MGYADYLRALLHPLRVYDLRAESFSGAELEAIGAVMDDVAAERAYQREQALIPTATEEGLALWEQLMHYAPVSATEEDRRRALAALMAISWDGFTPEALSAAVLGCGVNCTITETGCCAPLELRFPDIYGRPQPWDRAKWIVESLLPAHLELIYLFRWISWQEVHEKRLTWGQVSRKNWYEFMSNQV